MFSDLLKSQNWNVVVWMFASLRKVMNEVADGAETSLNFSFEISFDSWLHQL